MKFLKRFASDLDDVITSDLFHSNFAKKTDELESSQRESDDIQLEELPGVEDIPLYHVGRGLWGDIRYVGSCRSGYHRSLNMRVRGLSASVSKTWTPSPILERGSVLIE